MIITLIKVQGPLTSDYESGYAQGQAVCNGRSGSSSQSIKSEDNYKQ
jgi:hypothetical protein